MRFFHRRPASATPQTSKLWVSDLHTHQHLTFRTNPLKRACDYAEFVVPDEPSLDVIWLKDEVLGAANLPAPDVIAAGGVRGPCGVRGSAGSARER